MLYGRLVLKCGNMWAHGAFQCKLSAAGSAYFSTYTISTFASQTSFSEFLSKKNCWMHFSAGGELHNLDKRFLLTFPAPDCQCDRSLPSLMNSGAGGKKPARGHVECTLILQPRCRGSISDITATYRAGKIMNLTDVVLGLKIASVLAGIHFLAHL